MGINRTLAKDLASKSGTQVTMQGWLHNRVDKKKIGFLTIRDRSGLAMAIVEDMNEIAKLDGLYTGTVVQIDGLAQLEPANKKYGIEIKNAKITILESVKHVHGIDISKDELNLDIDTMIDNRTITLRHPRQTAIFKIYADTERAIRNFLDSQDFTQINTPKIIGFATEGGAEVFDFQYFEKQACLAQSPQFYKQMMVPVFERVYEIGKAYRAEKSNSSRHLSEILMLDVEMGFIDFDYLLQFVSDMLISVVDETRAVSSENLNKLGASKPVLPKNFPKITVAELHNKYLEATGEDLRGEGDISSAEEKWICEYSAENRGSDAVLVTDFARSEAKFYHIQDPNNPELAQRADLLFRGVEIATVPMRQTNYDKIVQQIVDQGIDPTNPGLKDYLDSFKYGMPMEGGFGFGISRLVQKIIGLSNIKEAELFPRDRNRLTP